MKTLVKGFTGLMAVVGVLFIVLGVYLIQSGNITLSERTEAHNVTVIRDGVVQSSRDWNSLLGYELKIDLYDGMYIGQ